MGRGRAKAKQTKVARELKYSTPNTDLTSLQRELSGGSTPPPAPAAKKDESPEEVDPYADDDDDFGSWKSAGS